jgi:hypothetical protein
MGYATRYLKWEDTIVGVIDEQNNVKFMCTNLNEVVKVITKGKEYWDKSEFVEFLTDRVISKGRRDIEKLLFRLGLNDYDIIKIAEKTYALNPKDLFWVAPNEEIQFNEAIKGTFENIFRHSLDDKGSTIYSPDGQNIKSYAISKGKYGINKKRLNNLMTDAESEVAVYKLAELLGVAVCPAWFVDEDTIFSQFVYDFTKEHLVHARHYFQDGERTGNQYTDLLRKFPKFAKEIKQMCLLDFITRQDDRHLSNLAILVSSGRVEFYPLYDNGRSLFYEDTPEIVAKAILDIPNYSTAFGEIGTYYDVIEEIAKTDNINTLVNLNIKNKEIYEILKDSGFKGYRLDGATKWIAETIGVLRRLTN